MQGTMSVVIEEATPPPPPQVQMRAAAIERHMSRRDEHRRSISMQARVFKADIGIFRLTVFELLS